MLRDGFLGYQASLMLDVVVVSLILVVPVLLFSLFVVRYRQQYRLHRTLQITLGLVLLIAVTAFEIDLHLIQGGWQNVVSKQTPPLTSAQMESVRTALRIHLVFAATTPILWIITTWLALREFPNPPMPSRHSRTHRVLGWLSTIDITLTSVTGLWFYYLAFIGR